jgi:hypothetical protein
MSIFIKKNAKIMFTKKERMKKAEDCETLQEKRRN